MKINPKTRKTVGTNGIILHRGQSSIDGSAIVVIMTGTRDISANPKTGDMLQTWILVDDFHPMEAIKTGRDSAICGSCPYRGDAQNPRLCYVKLMAPGMIWKTYRRGGYLDLSAYHDADTIADIVRDRFVRLGSYGDPLAVQDPGSWRWVDAAAGRTGYTHRWKNIEQDFRDDDRFGSELAWWRERIMASVDSEPERRTAADLGWRTFRPLFAGEDRTRGSEIQCPASKEAGYRATCADCRLCGGTDTGHRKIAPSVAINIHGPVVGGSRRLPRPVSVPITIGGIDSGLVVAS